LTLELANERFPSLSLNTTRGHATMKLVKGTLTDEHNMSNTGQFTGTPVAIKIYKPATHMIKTFIHSPKLLP
jgi:hypothetical protein